MQIFNEKEHVGQEEIQNVQCEAEESTGRFNVVAKACAKREVDSKVERKEWYSWSGTLPGQSCDL